MEIAMYEDGMSVSYDAVTKQVTVVFRGKKVILPGKFVTESEGKKAGEAYCRKQGWRG